MAEDHLTQLQTDPAYMRRYVQLIMEAEFSRLPDAQSYSMCVTDIDYDAWAIRHWGWICEEVAELKTLRTGFSDFVNQGDALPRKYGERLAALEMVVLQLMDIQSRQIQAVLPQCPGFCHMFDFEYLPHGELRARHKSWDDPNNTNRSVIDAEHFLQDPLDYCIGCLTTYPDSPRTLDHIRGFELLEDQLSKATPKERSRLDETLYRKLSDLAGFNEVLVMIRCHRPRAMQRGLEELKAAAQGRAWRYMSKTLEKREVDDGGNFVTVERTAQEIPLQYSTLCSTLKDFMDEGPMNDKSSYSNWLNKDTA